MVRQHPGVEDVVRREQRIAVGRVHFLDAIGGDGDGLRYRRRRGTGHLLQRLVIAVLTDHNEARKLRRTGCTCSTDELRPLPHLPSVSS